MSIFLKLKNFAMIQNLEIEGGDLTFFIGEQGTGKSLVLQLLKLLIDKNFIRKTLENYGLTWQREPNRNLELFYGEGMSEVWQQKTEILFKKSKITLEFLRPRQREQYRNATEEMFYIPAQRVMCLEDGWAKYFTNFSSSTPFVMRHFSETLRQLLEGFSSSNKNQTELFPISNRLEQSIRNFIEERIYNKNRIIIDQTARKNSRMQIQNSSIPFMAWSAGQKEFFPLLLSFYWLCPPSRVNKQDQIEIVIIEEPEMGLHPSAIHSIFIQILELLHRGYKVYVSTHSPHFLEYSWTLKNIQNFKGDKKRKRDAFVQLTELRRGAAKTNALFDSSLQANIKIYHFHKENFAVKVKDISELDVSSEDEIISEWGSLISLSQKASEIVSGLAE